MTPDRLLFPLMATSLAVGIGIGDLLAVPSGAAFALLPVAALSLWAYWLARRDRTAFAAFCFFFLLSGIVRAQLGDLHPLPPCATDRARELSDALSLLLRQSGLSPDTEALLDAMLLGRRGMLSPELRELYRRAGAAHVLALSGLHLGILFYVLNFLLLRLLQYRLRYVAGAAELLFMWGYAFVTGFPVSLCRATIMMSLFIIAQIRQTGNSSAHTLGVAAFLLLMISPDTLYDVGFQLSFSAVAGLVLFYKPLSALWVPRNRGLNRIWKGLMASVSVQLLTFPLSVHYFHRFSFSGILLSPLYLLLAALIIYVALSLLLFRALGAALLIPVLEGLTALQHGAMRLSLLLPLNSADAIHLPWSGVVLFYGAVLCLLPPVCALRRPPVSRPGYRRAMFFRSWPYLLSALFLALCGVWVSHTWIRE